MAEDEAKAQDGQQDEKKKSPMMTIIIVAVVMVLEAVGAVGFIMLSGGGASQANATGIEGEEQAEEEKTIEIPLVDGRFQNHSSTQPWSWNVEVVLQVKKKNEEKVSGELERRKAEVAEGVALIIRRAAHSHLMEPGLETLHRQISAYIDQVFGLDPDENPMVERVIIPRCQGMAQN